MSKRPPLSVTHPELAKQAVVWDPSLVTASSDKKLEWQCSQGHVFAATVYNRAKRKSGCPYCAGQRVLVGINDLASRYPALALEAHGWDPTSETYGTAHKKEWQCELGHVWTATVLSRSQGSGCPYCSNNRVLKGFNDLASLNPNLAAEAVDWNPREFLPFSNKKMKWKCQVGHEFFSSIANRSNGTGCAVCAGKKVIVGVNDFKSRFPEIAEEAHDWDPRTVTAMSGSKKKWKCVHGHIWLARVDSRQQNGCPVCSGYELLIGFNDLATTHPALASQSVDWDPKKYSRGSSEKKSWKCSEGHVWVASINSRANLERGCPTCANSGFDPNLEGWIYFLRHEQWGMLQIGITNTPENRLSKHSKLGWEVIEVRGPMDGMLARNWESSILKMLKVSGADISNANVAGKFDGYTEAWLTDSHPVKSLKELMAEVEQGEDVAALKSKKKD